MFDEIDLHILILRGAHTSFHHLVDEGESQEKIIVYHNRLLREEEYLNTLIHAQVCTVCPEDK